MSESDLTEKERFYRQAAWDRFSEEHRTDIQTTFARIISKEAFCSAFEWGMRYVREEESDGRD